MNLQRVKWPRLVTQVLIFYSALFALGGQISLAAPLPKYVGTYSYDAKNVLLVKVLKDFCDNFGIVLDISTHDSVKMNGKLSGATSAEFLDSLTQSFGLQWFYYAGVLYVSHISDWDTKAFAVSKHSISSLKGALTSLGVIDTRFGWFDMPEQGVVMVSGPRKYIALVDSTIQSFQLAPSGQKVAVFRLRYASAEDRTVNVRDQQIVIPGVAKVLRALLRGPKSAGEKATHRKAVPFDGSVDAEPPVVKDSKTALAQEYLAADLGGDASVQSDTRLNAIIVRDSVDSLSMYEQLIAALDVPAALIEIEAMTIDIGKTHLDELGVDWSLTTPGNLTTTFGAPSTTPSQGSIGIGYNATSIVKERAASLITKVRLLESKGQARIIGKPSILTTDNLVALIDLSQTFYVRVSGERVANLTPVTTGVMLKVTPRLIGSTGEQSEIHLSIDIEDGSLVSRSGLDLPVVQRSVISTQATIRENHSLLIGGYDSESERQNTEAVPGLSRVPALGALFRNLQAEQQSSKRLFLITPRVIAPAGTIAKNSIGSSFLDTTSIIAEPLQLKAAKSLRRERQSDSGIRSDNE